MTITKENFNEYMENRFNEYVSELECSISEVSRLLEDFHEASLNDDTLSLFIKAVNSELNNIRYSFSDERFIKLFGENYKQDNDSLAHILRLSSILSYLERVVCKMSAAGYKR